MSLKFPTLSLVVTKISLNFALCFSAESFFYALLRHDLTPFPYSVAIRSPCRNNSNKKLSNFLDLAQNPRTFASVKVHN